MSTDDLIYGIPILVVVQFILRTCWARWMQKWAKKKNLRSLYWVSFWLPTIGFLIVLFSRTRPSSYQDVLARPIEFNLADEKVTEVKNEFNELLPSQDEIPQALSRQEPNRLGKLYKLFESGAITEEEFKQLKNMEPE